MQDKGGRQEEPQRSSSMRAYWRAYSWMYLCVGVASILAGIATLFIARSGVSGHPVPEMYSVAGVLVVFGIWRIVLAASKLRKL